ncbi:MAG: mannose-6-phosphate isomerase, class I, partial [Spirochaetales bacterium]|nr:mannose-6-phosphate isomerase, class I [Spirochaetales bacterium]
LRLMDEYPGDIGALAPISMNLFELKPGQALNLAAGQPHAYLSGNAIEIMANSDNVLRGGLTSKHIDIPELISTLSFDSASVTPLAPAADPGGFMRYPTIAPDYSLAKAVVTDRLESGSREAVPEILLCTEGSLVIQAADGTNLPLPRGSSVFITADNGPYSIVGSGEVYKASVPS